MRFRPTLALALLSALMGCVGPAPTGTFVECRDGLAPTTRKVTCEANYALVAKGTPAVTGSFGEHHLKKGECIGFRRAPDGSMVAVAPGHTLALPPGAYAWEVVPGSVPSQNARVWNEVRECSLVAAKVTAVVVGVVCVCLVAFVLLLVIAVSSHKGFGRGW